jgi:hypothetical protein
LCVVCTVHQEMRSAGFLAWPEYQGRRFSWLGLKTCGFGFFGLGLKTGSFGLVMRATKSPRRFLDLGLKTKWATVYRLHHKTDGRMKTAWDARRDLAACFAWKQVGLEFPSLASRLAETWCIWCTWHHHRGRIELKLQPDGSMRLATSDYYTPTLPFSLY